VFEVWVSDVKIFFESEVKEVLDEFSVVDRGGFSGQLNPTKVRQILAVINDTGYARAGI
jgi:hypothetical protein